MNRKWSTLAAAAVVAAALIPPAHAAGLRVLVQLQAKPGAEQKLVEFTQQVMVDIRKVPGLQKVEVNVEQGQPGKLVLYYHWAADSDQKAYLASELYRRVGAGLEPLVAERKLTQLTNLD
jgi:quinol monooxygenase YgiN